MIQCYAKVLTAHVFAARYINLIETKGGIFVQARFQPITVAHFETYDR